MTEKYFGKYRGTVVNNVAPMMQGRILATVPDATGLPPGSWCLPCLPVLGLNSGIFSVPPIGAGSGLNSSKGMLITPFGRAVTQGPRQTFPAWRKLRLRRFQPSRFKPWRRTALLSVTR